MCDCDAPSVFNATLRVARKQHTCCECHTDIVTGETYEYSSGVWDHSGGSYKTCMVCAELRADYEAALTRYDCPPVFGSLYECVEDDDL